MKKLPLLLILSALAVSAQNFDQLTISPAHNGTSFVAGLLSWAESEDWPVAGAEDIGFRSPLSGVTAYDMTMPPEAPPELRCLFVNPTGQWSFETCRGSTTGMILSAATLPDETTDNNTCTFSRESHAVSGVDVFWQALKCSQNDSFSWTVRSPTDLRDSPDIRLWATSTSSFGTVSYKIKRRCKVSDGTVIYFTGAFDDTITDSHVFGATGRLALIEISLDPWNPLEDEICLFSVQQTSSASVTHFFMGELK